MSQPQSTHLLGGGNQPTVQLSNLDERARNAVKAFRQLQPMLTAFARVLTRNQLVRVELATHSNGETDGKRIFYRPPLELGDKREHTRTLCDKRDGDKQLRCDACRVMEEILVTIYHEISHIANDTFMPVSEYGKKEALEWAIKEHGTTFSKKLEKVVFTRGWISYIDLSQVVSNYLPLLVNALEDARIEQRMFDNRPGTKVMFEASIWKTFNEGVECKAEDGSITVSHWRDRPLNSQITVGIYALAGGFEIGDDWFAPEVLEALRDPTLVALCGKAAKAKTAESIYRLSFPILARCRELGYLKSKNDPDNEPEPEEPEDGPEQEPEPDDAEGMAEPTPGESDSDSTGEDSDESSGESDDTHETGDTSSSDEAEGSESSDSGTDSGDADDDNQEGSAGSSAELDDESSDESDLSDRDGSAGSQEDGSVDDSETDDSETDTDDDDGGEGDGSSDSPDDGAGTDSSGGADGLPEESSDEGVSRSGMEDSGDSGDEFDDEVQQSHCDGTEQAGSEGGSASGTEGDELDESEDDSSGTSGGADQGKDKSLPGDLEDADEDPGETDGPGSGDMRGDDPAGSADGDNDDSDSDAAELGTDATDPQPDPVEPARDGPQTDTNASFGGDGTPTDPDDSLRETPNDGERDSDSAVDAEELDDELLDTGADDGTGGVELKNKPRERDYGNEDDVKADLLKMLDHEEKPKSVSIEEAEDNAISKAIIQGIYFEQPSSEIYGVNEFDYGKQYFDELTNNPIARAWDRRHYLGHGQGGLDGYYAGEQILGPALLEMRRTFEDNARGKHERNRKRGKVDAGKLGKRAPMGDPRIFEQRTLPGKKKYICIIGMDISGSTNGVNIDIEKSAVTAQAELLERMGIAFAIYAHTGTYRGSMWSSEMMLDVYRIKNVNEPWDTEVKTRLAHIGPDGVNLDGHFLEYLRKRADEVKDATDVVIMYFSDGKMPAANFDEELEVLQREILICQRKRYALMGVGIRTDSPVQHGLDTVQLDTVKDTSKVIVHLKKALLRTRV